MMWGEGIKEKFDLSLGMDEFPRDLLPNRIPNCVKLEVMKKEEEMELSLGLSMNGRFGVDPSSKKFKRSSSVTNLVFTVESSGVCGPELIRTRSLPTAAEEEWRRRKDWLSNRRLEARKKRMEKLKNLRALKGNGYVETRDGCTENQTQSTCSTSAASDLNPNESKQDSKAPNLQHRSNNKASEMEKSVTEMPYVSTKGEGVNKVDGFLYRYKNGEDVRIVCVCHGLFLSPAEFVKHGGGGDVENPLKHIVVNPFPLV